jgi:hypothetical protein
MSDWRNMFDRDYIGHWDIGEGRDAVVVIATVEAKKVGEGIPGRKADRKPILKFEGKDKGMVCNKTNAKAIAAMYGNDTREWVGKPIALYVTTTSSPDGTVPCIRVRPTPPKPKTQKNEVAE